MKFIADMELLTLEFELPRERETVMTELYLHLNKRGYASTELTVSRLYWSENKLNITLRAESHACIFEAMRFIKSKFCE